MARHQNRRCNTTCSPPKCPPRGATGPTGPGSSGATGPTGPCCTGPTGPATSAPVLNPIGLLVLDVTGPTVITDAMLQNPTFPGARYAAIRFVTTGDPAYPIDVSLPNPAPNTNDAAYTIIVENEADGQLHFTNTVGGTDDFFLASRGTTEQSLEALVVGYVNETTSGVEYRTEVLVTPSGVYRVPGYSTTDAP